MPESLGMRTAREWHREQLLQARLRMEQRNALRLKRGQILTTLTTSLTCDHAREDAGLDTIATDIPLHRDPDDPQRPYPFRPGHYPHTSLHELRSDQVDNLPRSLLTWRLFASRVKTLSRWSISCPRPSSKTTKIPTQYRLPAQGMAVRGQRGRGQARVAGQSSDDAPRPPSYNTACGEQRRESAPILIPEDFEVNEGDQVIPFTITDRFRRPTLARYIRVNMTSNPYVIARLTANGPDYWGKLHAMPYNGLEDIEPLTDEAMRMLEPDFPAAEHVSNTLRRMGDRTLWAEVIRYRAKVSEIDKIRVQREDLQRRCYMVGLEMGLSRQQLQEARAVQRIIEDMVQDTRTNQQSRQRGQRGRGRPA